MAQAVELLHSKLEVLSSNYSLIKKKKNHSVSVEPGYPLGKNEAPLCFPAGCCGEPGLSLSPTGDEIIFTVIP
jgi:hypothetical protein